MVLVGENRYYLSNYTGEDSQFDETAGVLFITDSRLLLATDTRFDEQARNESPMFEVYTYKEGLAKAMPDILSGLDTEQLGFESIRMSYLQYEKILKELKKAGSSVKLIPATDMVEKFRVIKTETEVQTLKKALHLAESAFSNVLSNIRPGMTELELAWMLEKKIRETDGASLSFPSIIASGPNSALPHAIPGNRKVQGNEPLLFDWGVKLNGYCSDISRTLSLGRPDDTFKKVYQIVQDAQNMAIEAIKPGISSKTIDQIARNHIHEKGYGDHFGHGLGHGTGLAVHESPHLSPLKDVPLEPGMISTIEPGIYLPGWGGIRLENMIVVRDYGAEILNQSDTDDYRFGGE